MIVIGITGTLGAGKGTIVDYLVNTHNFRHYSVRDYITEIIVSKNLPVNRDTMTMVGNELRANHSPCYIAEELYKKANESGENCIIESIRAVGEVEALRKKENFTLFAVDADPKLRCIRITARKSATDNVSYDEFIANEQREMQSADPNTQNLQKVIAMADYVFDNGKELDYLYKQVEEIISKIS